MKIFLKYVKNFNTIVVLFKNKKVMSTKKEQNCEILFHENEVIGLNIFNFESDDSFNLEDKRLQKKAEPFIKKYLAKFELENQFIIAKILECEKIPNTHLSICKLDNGKEVIQVICGAVNARKNLFTTLATVGSWMPDGTQINQGKLKGFDSFGMLCSAKELEIKQEKYNKPGIMEWEVEDSYIGRSIWEVLNEK